MMTKPPHPPAPPTVAVFCGAQSGHSPAFHAAATALGTGLARRGIRLVYGGGRIGLMGAVADAALAAGGEVVGVIPEFLTQWEVAHEGVSQMMVTDSMHTRKRHMFELSQAFLSLPGGLGTLDETFEIITWRQLRLHDKPILVLDVAGSAQPLLDAIESAISLGFAKPEVRALYETFSGVEATLDRLEALLPEAAPADAQTARL
jgi:uncharacterized protein (TIGR00730 family)